MGFVAEAQLSGFDFIRVAGVRLRYCDSGVGRTPVVLLHGNGSMIEDFLSSGIVEHAGSGYQFIAFDRPGFGHSERPHGCAWGPSEQANLLLDALARLGIERPIIVGHSWGALVAMAMALESPEEVAGLVLMSGYYYPVPHVRPIAAPFGSDVVRYAIRRLMAPQMLRRVFAPCTVPDRFKRDYPLSLATRVSQMQAVDEDAAGLLPAARALCRLYRNVSVPVHLIAGSDDRIVDTELHSGRLHRELGTSTFHCVRGCGHMVHHAAPDKVISAIASISQGTTRAPESDKSARRNWLHIGESLAAA